MPSSSETSFGARLLRAKTLHSYISNFSGYNPPRTQETAADLNTLLDDITAVNANESSLQQNYNTAVNNRYNAFRTDTVSVFKLLAPIRAAVEAQFGKGSTEFDQIDSIVKSPTKPISLRLYSYFNLPLLTTIILLFSYKSGIYKTFFMPLHIYF